jgi:hypothetical protein
MEGPCYAPIDEALAILAGYGPDLANGLTNHAPMAAEALCALGRPEAVLPWIERYRSGMLPWPPARERIARESWRLALGVESRAADWRALFADELEGAPWREVLDRWVARLAPGFCASAMHGVIRVGHAVRSLALAESPPRRCELADALASWASTYQELPGARLAAGPRATPNQAIERVPLVPPERRRFRGTITSSLEALAELPAFAPVIDWIEVGGDPEALASELSEVFARVYLGSARDVLTSIVFVHAVTGVAALRSLLPHVSGATARAALRFAWQGGCALYAAFGTSTAQAGAVSLPLESGAELADRAVEHGDEHAIKLAEACLRENALRPSPAHLAAARAALDTLPRA